MFNDNRPEHLQGLPHANGTARAGVAAADAENLRAATAHRCGADARFGLGTGTAARGAGTFTVALTLCSPNRILTCIDLSNPIGRHFLFVCSTNKTCIEKTYKKYFSKGKNRNIPMYLLLI